MKRNMQVRKSEGIGVEEIQEEAVQTEKRIRPSIRGTPLERSPILSQMSGAKIGLDKLIPILCDEEDAS